MFFLKQLLGALIMPLPVVLLLLTAGVILLWFTSRERWGKVLVTAGALLLLVASLPSVGERLIAPLETRYPHILEPADTLPAQIQWIVVLGGGLSADPTVQPHVRVSDEALFRVMEGVRLQRGLPHARILFTGYGGASPVSSAEANADVAREFGVPEDRIEVDPRPRDTEEEAQAALERIQPGEPFYLVTSAAHLPRSVEHFRTWGLEPIPAPAHRYALDAPRSFRGHFPQADGLRMTERAVHERVGMLWRRIRPSAAAPGPLP